MTLSYHIGNMDPCIKLYSRFSLNLTNNGKSVNPVTDDNFLKIPDFKVSILNA